jgi:uncharacterized protein (TIGR02246 family)
MHSRYLVLSLAAVLAGCASSSAARTSAADDEAAVAAAMDAYVKDIRGNDAAKIASWWTDDLVYIDRNAPTIAGRAALESTLKGELATMSVTSATVNKDELSVSGDLAYYLGSYEEVLQPPKGDALHNRGRFVFIWKRQADGSWKIARSVGTDLATAPAAPAVGKDSSKAKGG